MPHLGTLVFGFGLEQSLARHGQWHVERVTVIVTLNGRLGARVVRSGSPTYVVLLRATFCLR